MQGNTQGGQVHPPNCEAIVYAHVYDMYNICRPNVMALLMHSA